MRFFNLKNKKEIVSFKTACIKGLGEQKGLFFPTQIPFLQKIDFEKNIHELGFDILYPFVKEDMSETQLKDVLQHTLCFDFPLHTLNENTLVLELFHGETLAFKDVGARFLAASFGIFASEFDKPIKVLVATSGDTGGAVAAGFHKVPNVEVVILYPKGRVSTVQELQLTTMGENIKAVEIDGTFDDCQALVKQAFSDSELNTNFILTSANSINVARWLPQTLYYAKAVKELINNGIDDINMIVPSGNFGNICAGILLKKMGFPIQHFVAATNMNDTIPQYFETKEYTVKQAKATISNAMDVAEPSNLTRIEELYEYHFESMKHDITSVSISEDETKNAILYLYNQYHYVACPHTAVGFSALQKLKNTFDKKYTHVLLSTAHPVKFPRVVEDIIGTTIPIPQHVQHLFNKPQLKTTLPNDYKYFFEFIQNS